MSWDQIVALTHKDDVMLRPTLSDDTDPETAELVRMCWAHDPAERPSFAVILAFLDTIKGKQDRRHAEEQNVKNMRRLFRSIHDLL